jgi:HK97 family phage major capsid protein
MKKIKLKLDGLTGETLAFAKSLNEAFESMGDQITETDVQSAVKKLCKGMFAENGDLSVDFVKLASLHDEVLGDGENSIKSILKRQGEVVNALKELRSASEGTRVKSVRDQLKGYLDGKKSDFEAFLRGEKQSFGVRQLANGDMTGDLEVKVPATITVGTHSGGSAFVPQVELVPGLVDLARNRPFLESFANVSNTNRSRIVWTEKFNPEGQAAFLGEGGVKPLIDFEYRTPESFAKKVAAKIKVSTEALQDIDWMAAEIEAELKYQVDIEVDEALLAGTGDGTSTALPLKGLTSYAGGYVLTTITTTTPNNFDALRAAFAQIVSLNFEPTHVFINPIDGANMDLVKDSQGRPIMMEYRDQRGRLFRLQPVETNQIPVGSFLMGDMSKFRVRNYIPFSIYWGWVNDDFEKNLVTIIGERRLHSYVYNNQVGAFIYDTFADVKTAITAAP